MATDPTRYLPLKPSNLRVPSGPISPASPLTPPAPRTSSPPYSPLTSSSSTMSDASPEYPMPWVWTCHLCRSHYPLGATRRCLDDGHYFCPGTSIDRRTGRIKKHNACSSDFDYNGWKAYGDWKRRYQEEEKPDFVHGSKDCSKHCDYPSECRWTAKRAAKSSRFGDRMPGLDKHSKTTLTRVVESAEGRTDRLSPVEEELSSAAPKESGPGLDLTGLKSNFDTFEKILDDSTDISRTVVRVLDPGLNTMDLDLPPLAEPQVTIKELEVDPDSNIMDLDPSYEQSKPQFTVKEFEFGFEQDPQICGQTSPTSPRRNAWDWTIGAIGAALTFADETEVSESSSEDMIDCK